MLILFHFLSLLYLNRNILLQYILHYWSPLYNLYPYRVAQNYYPFYERFYKELSHKEQEIFIQSCFEILKRLKSYLETTTTASDRTDVKKSEKNLLRIFKELNITYETK